MVKYRSRWVIPLISAESKSSSSSLCALLMENSVDSFITLTARMVLFTTVRINANHGRKKGPYVVEDPKQVTSPTTYFFLPGHCIVSPFVVSQQLPTRGVPGAHIPACGTAASRAYSSSIRLCHYASATYVFDSVSSVALRSRSSTRARSSSSIRCLSKAQVRSSSCRCCCHLSLSLALLASSSPSSLLSLSLSRVFAYFWGGRARSRQGGSGRGGEGR